MSPTQVAWAALLSGLVAAACVHDVRARRIPNGLVAATLGAGIAHAAAAPALLPGLGAALLGALLGLCAWLPFYALGMLGAGDVKLFAAGAAWLGPSGVLPATVYAAAAGAVLAAVWMTRARLAPATPRRLPYGIAVGAGVLAVAWGGR